MRIFLFSILTLLSLMGLPLSAAECGCSCHHPEGNLQSESGIHAVSCCQSLPADCCVQHHNAAPKQPLFAVTPQSDSFSSTLATVATLIEERAMVRPQTGTSRQQARAPPLPPSEHRSRLQSWLI